MFLFYGFFFFFHLNRLAYLPPSLRFEWTSKIMRLFCSPSMSLRYVNLVSQHGVSHCHSTTVFTAHVWFSLPWRRVLIFSSNTTGSFASNLAIWWSRLCFEDRYVAKHFIASKHGTFSYEGSGQIRIQWKFRVFTSSCLLPLYRVELLKPPYGRMWSGK